MYIYDILKNRYPTEYGMNTIENLLTGLDKKIRICQRLWLEIAENSFEVFLWNFSVIVI